MDLKDLQHKYGQSVWLDYIRRHLLQSGEFARLVKEDGIRGVTSNPSIFEKAIAGSTDYEAALQHFEQRTLHGYLRAHLSRLERGDYFALLAYVERNDAHDRQLQTIRRLVRDRRRVATCVGFGPRFLHSTGQAYKGGPNSGVFLQLTCDDAQDLQIPGRRFSFGVVKAAQARGDFRVLAQRERRALRVHLGADVERGLDLLDQAIRKALT